MRMLMHDKVISCSGANEMEAISVNQQQVIAISG